METTVPVTCGCGGGTLINQRLRRVLDARKLGTKNKEIAAREGCSVATVKAASRQIARYAPGHHSTREFQTRTCIECSGEFRVPSTSTRRYCKKRYCVSGTLAYYQSAGGPEQWDQRRELDNEQRRLSHAQTLGRLYTESRDARIRAKRAIAKGYKPGPDIPTLAEQLADCDEQIRALYAEQICDARREQIQFAPSLDRRFDADDDGSWLHAQMGSVYFDRDDDRWAYYAGQGRRSRSRVST